MTNKTVKDAVEHFGGVWPDCDFLSVHYKDRNAKIFDKIECETDDYWQKASEWVITKTPITHEAKIGGGTSFIVEKQLFEDYVKEQKMDKQKYKYVNAEIKTVGEFIDRVINNEKIYKKDVDVPFSVSDGQINLGIAVWGFVSISIEMSSFVIRQTLPWYEMDGVFPCLVAVNMIDYNILNYSDRGDGHVRIAREITAKDGDTYIRTCNDKFYLPQFCTPLTPSEAAKYGVECE